MNKIPVGVVSPQGQGKLPPSIGGEWAIPQSSKLKYTQLFNSNDRQRTGFLTGVQARNILIESKLPQDMLAKIWNLADIDVDGRLSCEEFVLAMYLIDKAKAKEILPVKLPPELVPPSYRRTVPGSGSSGAISTGTLSHGSSLDEASIESNDGLKNSFEDKRKENYDKGKAELERRRAVLLEQQRREKEERERKEREENAKREKARLEAERKKQEELERQQAKIRAAELEKEEAKRRAQEVRELARKEAERQRQAEVEKTRRNELTTARARLMEEVQKLKSRKKTLAIEHEQTDKQLAESRAICATSRDKIVKIKTEIDGMRLKRDEIMQKQNAIKAQMKSFTEQQLFIEQEKVRMAAQLKSMMGRLAF